MKYIVAYQTKETEPPMAYGGYYMKLYSKEKAEEIVSFSNNAHKSLRYRVVPYDETKHELKKMKPLSGIEKALAAWYKPGNPLYKNPEVAALGLAGEVGELVDLYKEHIYRPGFDWTGCKNCGEPSRSDMICRRLIDSTYNHIPFIMSELGDIWYYLRILAWMGDVDLLGPAIMPEKPHMSKWIKKLHWITSLLLHPSPSKRDDLQRFYDYLIILLNSLDYTIEDLTEFNYLTRELND